MSTGTDDGFAELVIDNNTLSSAYGRGIRIANTAGQTTIKSLQNNVVTSGIGGFTFLNGVVFDSDLTLAGFQAVSGGTTVLGSTTSRLTFDAIVFADQNNPYEGILEFDSLQTFTDGGRGILLFRRSTDAQDFELAINGGEINVLNVNQFQEGIRWTTGGTKLTLNNLDINMNGDADPFAVNLENLGATATVLSGSGNSLTNVLSSRFKSTSGSFSGLIDFGGGNTLP